MPLLPEDSADTTVSSSFLTQDELAEISTRKVRIARPSNTDSYSKDELAKLETHKVSAVLPPLEPMRERTSAVLPGIKKSAHPARDAWLYWYAALKKIGPVYIAVHIALLAISCLSFLYTDHDFASKIFPISTLWTQWHHWDTGNYMQIALHGYLKPTQFAFFPFYPLLERAGMFVTKGDPFPAGLIISNVAELVMFTVLYRLLEQDFGGDRAFYSVLYFAIFPTAFFFSIAYTESTFLCLSTLAFYQIRRGRWWAAALFGFPASLTRPDGMFLLIPFCYEYLRRKWPADVSSLHEFFAQRQLWPFIKSIRLDLFIGLLIPGGVYCMMVYGYVHFGDALTFIHAHAAWDRFMTVPGYGMFKAVWAIYKHGVMSFTTMRTLTDLIPDMLLGALILLMFIGTLRLPPRLWAYGLYAFVLYLYFQMFTRGGTFPLESMSRFLLEIFPAFIVLAQIHKNRLLHLSYMMLSLALFFFLSSQFATGHWVL